MIDAQVEFRGEEEGDHPVPAVDAVQTVIGEDFGDVLDAITLEGRAECGDAVCGLNANSTDDEVRVDTRYEPAISIPLPGDAELPDKEVPVYAPNTVVAASCPGRGEGCADRVRATIAKLDALVTASTVAVEEAYDGKRPIRNRRDTEIADIEETRDAAIDAANATAEEKRVGVEDTAREDMERVDEQFFGPVRESFRAHTAPQPVDS